MTRLDEVIMMAYHGERRAAMVAYRRRVYMFPVKAGRVDMRSAQERKSERFAAPGGDRSPDLLICSQGCYPLGHPAVKLGSAHYNLSTSESRLSTF